MVDFAGWSLPVQYSDFGIIDSCLHTRSRASLFDVSHMLQLRVYGPRREDFIESLTVGDIKGLKEGESRLSVFTTETGGIIDDTVITKQKDYLQIVLNAGCAEKDMKHIESFLKKNNHGVELAVNIDYSLLALQGPESATVLQSLVKKDLSQLAFMSAIPEIEIAGISGCAISRSGYTGEDGFELSIPSDEGANHIASNIISHRSVKLAGLGARDTLRIEAGLCLYGSDIDETITPVEAGLAWTVSKRRRLEGGFPGDSVIQKQLKEGVVRKRVGLNILSGPPARHDNSLYIDEATAVGKTTSGTFSPSLGKAVAIGYVSSENAVSGTPLMVDVRGKRNPVVVTKMPFVKSNYYRPGTK
jgi:aminomethyltransferase